MIYREVEKLAKYWIKKYKGHGAASSSGRRLCAAHEPLRADGDQENIVSDENLAAVAPLHKERAQIGRPNRRNFFKHIASSRRSERSAIQRAVRGAGAVVGALLIVCAERRPAVQSVNLLVRNVVHGHRDTHHARHGEHVRPHMAVGPRSVVGAPVGHDRIHVRIGANQVDGQVGSVRSSSVLSTSVGRSTV